jgi:hypothetical protein
VNAKWTALSREAGLAAEHMAIGVTAIGKANYASSAYYFQAFFALSVGFERAAKLALVVDYALQNRGAFPKNPYVRSFGHELGHLLDRVDEVAARLQTKYRMPNTPIHTGIISVLNNFAANITRYYNIDLVTEAQRVSGIADHLKDWFERVTVPILTKHYKAERRERDRRNARIVADLMAAYANVLHTSESGTQISELSDASMQTASAEAAAPWVRLYLLQIARFLGGVLSSLGREGMNYDSIPYFADFFAIYNNDDSYLRSRKRWSIYRT